MEDNFNKFPKLHRLCSEHNTNSNSQTEMEDSRVSKVERSYSKKIVASNGETSSGTRKIVKSNCWIDEVEPGRFVQKCEKTVQHLKDCLGKPTEVVESRREYTESDYTPEVNMKNSFELPGHQSDVAGTRSFFDGFSAFRDATEEVESRREYTESDYTPEVNMNNPFAFPGLRSDVEGIRSFFEGFSAFLDVANQMSSSVDEMRREADEMLSEIFRASDDQPDVGSAPPSSSVPSSSPRSRDVPIEDAIQKPATKQNTDGSSVIDLFGLAQDV